MTRLRKGFAGDARDRYEPAGTDEAAADLAEMFRAMEQAAAGRPVPDVVAAAAMMIGNCVLMTAVDRADAHCGIDACAEDIRNYVDANMAAAELAAAEPAGHA